MDNEYADASCPDCGCTTINDFGFCEDCGFDYEQFLLEMEGLNNDQRTTTKNR